jgi:hypothetical protein
MHIIAFSRENNVLLLPATSQTRSLLAVIDVWGFLAQAGFHGMPISDLQRIELKSLWIRGVPTCCL